MTIADSARRGKRVRRRHPPAVMRAELIQAARTVLRDDGPQAITLQAVAARVGVSHANVTYHFGTAAALHTALIAVIVEDLTAATAVAVAHLRAGETSPRSVVDVVFDALESDGAGRLIAWLVAIGDSHRLAPFYAMIAEFVGELSHGDAGERAGGVEAIGLIMAAIVIPALGGALIGADMETVLGLQQGSVRGLVADGMARLRHPSGASGPRDASKHRE